MRSKIEGEEGPLYSHLSGTRIDQVRVENVTRSHWHARLGTTKYLFSAGQPCSIQALPSRMNAGGTQIMRRNSNHEEVGETAVGDESTLYGFYLSRWTGERVLVESLFFSRQYW